MSNIYAKTGDTYQKIRDTLLVDGVPMDLTGAIVGIKFKDIHKTTVPATSLQGTIVGPPINGNVEVQLTPEITVDEITYLLEWEVTIAGAKLTFPNGANETRYHKLIVIPDLDLVIT